MKAERTAALIEGSADMAQLKELASISSLIAPLATIHGIWLSFTAFGPDSWSPYKKRLYFVGVEWNTVFFLFRFWPQA